MEIHPAVAAVDTGLRFSELRCRGGGGGAGGGRRVGLEPTNAPQPKRDFCVVPA